MFKFFAKSLRLGQIIANFILFESIWLSRKLFFKICAIMNHMVNENHEEGVSESDETEFLTVVIPHLQHLYDSMSQSLDNVRTRSLTFLGGEIAIISFLFTTGSFSNAQGILNIAFLCLGVVLLLTAFFLLLWILQPSSWGYPPDTKDTRDLTDRFCGSKLKYLRYMKSEYEEFIRCGVKAINLRSALFAWAIRALSAGILILLVLKYL